MKLMCFLVINFMVEVIIQLLVLGQMKYLI